MEIDVLHANYYLGALYYTLYVIVVNGIPEVPLTLDRLGIFYKQKELCLYPAWAYAIPAALLKIPLSFVEPMIWTSVTYYVIGYSPEFCRLFRQIVLLTALHLPSTSMFRFMASVVQTLSSAIAGASIVGLLLLLFSGIVISRVSLPVWLRWGFWISPLSYGEAGLFVNEFLAPRWQKTLFPNITIGSLILESRGLHFEQYFYWIALGALVGFSIVFNIGFTLALTFRKPPRVSRSIISSEKISRIQNIEDPSDDTKSSPPTTNKESTKGRMVLPFQPVTMTFQDVQYYIDTPLEIKKAGFAENKLQLLSHITGAFRPGVLTALMGVTGAGKTSLLDVLAGRKTV